MENGIQVFSAETFGSVRVVENGGELFFVAKDVAEALEYTWKGIATINHIPEEWRGVYSVQTPSGEQEMLTLSEQGLYFFLARSDKPKALPYQKWIAGEVMPSIRRTGNYSIAQRNSGEQMPGVTLSEKILSARAILDDIGIKGNQRALALDNVYKKATGESALETMEIALPSERQEQLLTPTQLGQLIGGLSGKKVNQILIDEGYQRRLPGGALEPTAKGLDAGAVLMDTGKRHSSGVPVCQLKWRSSVASKIASAA